MDKFKKGDRVNHPTLGHGIVLGGCRRNTWPIWYVYYTDRKTYGYATSLLMESPADTDSAETADRIMSEAGTPDGSPIKYGDRVYHRIYGSGICLGHAHIRRTGLTYYNVFYTKNRSCGCNADISLVKKATKISTAKADRCLYRLAEELPLI